MDFHRSKFLNMSLSVMEEVVGARVSTENRQRLALEIDKSKRQEVGLDCGFNDGSRWE